MLYIRGVLKTNTIESICINEMSRIWKNYTLPSINHLSRQLIEQTKDHDMTYDVRNQGYGLEQTQNGSGVKPANVIQILHSVLIAIDL